MLSKTVSGHVLWMVQSRSVHDGTAATVFLFPLPSPPKPIPAVCASSEAFSYPHTKPLFDALKNNEL